MSIINCLLLLSGCSDECLDFKREFQEQARMVLEK